MAGTAAPRVKRIFLRDRSTFASFCTTYKGGKKDTKVRLNGIFRAIWRVQYARGKVCNPATRWDMRLSENKNQTSY